MSFVDTSVPETPIEAVEIVAEPDLETEVDAQEGQVEAEARAMGWHGPEDYRGPPERFVDAAEFVRRGKAELPILRDQLRRMTDRAVKNDAQLAELRNTVSEQTNALKELRELARKADERGYQRALDELKDKRRTAVQSGDQEAFDQIDQQIEALQQERAKTPPSSEEAVPRPAPPKDPAIVAFEIANPWWNSDGFLSRQMIARHEGVMAEHPDWPLSDQLDAALAELKRSFPNRFPGEEAPEPTPTPVLRSRTPTVAAPRGGSRIQSGPKTGWERIENPAERGEAQAAFQRIQRQQPDITVDEYLSVYLDPHADVIEVQRTARKRA